MAASQNGWRANDRSVIHTVTVPGTTTKLAVREGAPGDLLIKVAELWHRNVEDLDDVFDDWGYAERPIRGGSDLSNHASGTAVDLNATRHPLATRPEDNLNGEQIATVRDIIRTTGNVVRWGGDYRGRKDPMHFEINDGQGLDDCVRALQALGGVVLGGQPSRPSGNTSLRKGPPWVEGVSKGAKVFALQAVLNAWYPWLNLKEDGFFGDQTERAVIDLQKRAQIMVDGIAGAQTLGVLHLA